MPFSPDRALWPPNDTAQPPPVLDTGEIHLWLLPLDLADEALSAAAGQLDETERDRAQRFHFEVHRRRFIAGRGQLRQILAGYLALTPAAVDFRYGAQGKPFILGAEDEGPPLQFNLSHSEDVALLGIAREAAIGVDIEAARAMNDAVDIARDNFSRPEFEVWQSLPDALKCDGFFACWSRKEAIVKAMGGGLSIPLDSFQVSLDPRTPARLHSIDAEPDAPQRWTLWGEPVMPGFWGAVAAKAPGLTIRRLSAAA
jgi:4'-phosphopantetheinyl transferase